MKRELTNSITHLVKIVAAEVIEENIKIIGERLKEHGYLREHTIKIDGSAFLQNIRSSLRKAGAAWSSEEDALLVQEVRTAVAQIAKNHDRSIGAINSRITQKGLIWE